MDAFRLIVIMAFVAAGIVLIPAALLLGILIMSVVSAN